MDLAERINEIKMERELQRLSVQQLADMSGLSASTVSRTLNGKTEPSGNTLHAMEQALGLDVTPPVEDSPVTKRIEDDPLLRYYFALQESRIVRQRAHYNLLLSEKNRWIKFLLVIVMILVCFICFMLVYDVTHHNIGYVQIGP